MFLIYQLVIYIDSQFGSLRQHVRVELHRLGHVSLDLHFSRHEGLLGLQLSLSHLAEVSVEHDESAIRFAFFLERNFAVSILQVYGDDGGLVTLSFSELEVVHAADFVDDLFAIRLENGLHLFENF